MSSRRFCYLYIAPHPFVLTEGRIRRIGLELAWPVIALFGKQLRDLEDTLHKPTRGKLATQYYMDFNLFNRRRRCPWTLSDHGIETEATLYLITRPQIAIGVVSLILPLTVGVTLGWFIYPYGVIGLLRIWWLYKGTYELALFLQNPLRLIGDLGPVLRQFTCLFISLFISSQNLNTYLSSNLESFCSSLSPFWQEHWRCLQS